MADANAAYSGGCVVKSGQGGALPFARFIWAALCPPGQNKDSQLAYIHYEQGGFTHLYYVACYDCEALGDEPLWREVVPEALGDISSLAEIIQSRSEKA